MRASHARCGTGQLPSTKQATTRTFSSMLQRSRNVRRVTDFYCKGSRRLYLRRMETPSETPLLTEQTHSDADAALARRIRVIYKEFGGLGAFFDRLNQDREAQSPCSENRV